MKGGHYTAMVWGDTREVGCGTASGGGVNFVVCRYNPPGNFVGEVPFGPGAAQAVGEDAGAPPLQEEGAAAPIDEVGGGGGDDGGGGGDDGGGGDGGGDDGGGGDGDAN